MSVAYFIVLNQENPGFDTMVNGKALAQNASRLEKTLESLGLPSLDDYVSYSPDEARAMMEDFGTDPSELAKMQLPEQKWFDPQEGLDFVSKLTAHIQANPSAVKNTKRVLADLEEYRQVLEQAKAIGARWNLQVDF